jgi:hypothetical protein
MNSLRSFGDCDEKARHFSKRESMDVLITCADGSRHLYVGGEECSPIRFAAAMPQWLPGDPVSEMDMTPVEVKLGKWIDEVEDFVHSRKMPPEDFLKLADLIRT